VCRGASCALTVIASHSRSKNGVASLAYGEAIQSESAADAALDCFVASLLAMTVEIAEALAHLTPPDMPA
jgi:hypothetical protein